jgi:hypothetical protein
MLEVSFVATGARTSLWIVDRKSRKLVAARRLVTTPGTRVTSPVAIGRKDVVVVAATKGRNGRYSWAANARPTRRL